MYTGNLGIANDIETILDAQNYYKMNLRYIFFIYWGGMLVSKFKKIVKEKCLNNVSFLPSPPKTEMPALLSLSSYV